MSHRCYRDRKKVFENQGGLCYWCKKKIVLYNVRFNWAITEMPQDASTIDHIYPVSDPRRMSFKKNGIPSPWVLCCNVCNKRRRDMLVEDWENLLNIEHGDWATI